MIFESLKVVDLMGCNYEIEFDSRCNVVIGTNRQGKTLNARLIMLALYGTGQREKELHDSWKLRTEELLPVSDKGSVELVFRAGDKRYKIYREFGKRSRVEYYTEKEGLWRLVYRKDVDVKTALEEEVGITPGLMNVVMSNEQSLIGAISYDDKLQASVWEGWKWRSEIIRGNIKKARDKGAREGSNLGGEIEGLQGKVNSILDKWLEKGIFSKDEVKKGIDKEALETKLSSIAGAIKGILERIRHYSEFHDDLIKLDDLESKTIIESIIRICEEEEEFLDEKKDIRSLKTKCGNYSKTLADVLDKGGKDGIQSKFRNLGDEEKKLNSAKGLKERKMAPLKAECNVYPPEDRENLVIQIPDEVAAGFKYEEIAGGGIAVPYDEKKEEDIKKEKRKLEELIEEFEREKSKIKDGKDILRDKIGKKKDQLREKEMELREQTTILEGDKDRYLGNIEEVVEKNMLVKRLDTAKNWFGILYNALSEEESLRKIRKETVAFINRIYEKVYEWDINAKLEKEDRIIITDAQGNIRSHPSGSEIHILGLAWRWMVARAFDLPLVLDELDVLLDEKNFEKTRRLIEEEMDRQTVILTLKEGLKDLPGKIYRIAREHNVSTLEVVK